MPHINIFLTCYTCSKYNFILIVEENNKDSKNNRRNRTRGAGLLYPKVILRNDINTFNRLFYLEIDVSKHNTLSQYPG